VGAAVASAPTWSERRPWMGLFIWGWRLELALGLTAFTLLLIARSLGSVGPLFITALALVATHFKKEIRRDLSRQLTTHREQRWLHAALWHCAIVGRSGTIPKVVRSGTLPVGYRYLVELPIGLHYELMTARAPELAAALGARQVRMKAVAQNARYVEIAVILSSAFPKSLVSPLSTRRSVSLWEPLLIGVGQDGLPVSIGLPEHNLLIGGEPGSGKSVALSTIVGAAALDPTVTITLLDGKHVELAAWSLVADRFVGSNQEEAVDALEDLREVMDLRYASLALTRRRKIAPSDLEGLHLLVVDELAFFLRGGQKVTRDRFAELLRDLVSRGRAAGIIVVAATQKPSHEVIPTWIRDLFSFRLAMRCTSPDASDTILGQGWASQGYSATSIDPAMRGMGFLLAEGGVPTLIMTPYLSDDEIDVLAARALELRRAQ
jgi:DNA segregation ATPase FtsK/SpoIIIE-like protein